MKKKELIAEIYHIVLNEGNIIFDKPFPEVRGEEVCCVNTSGTLELENDDEEEIELEELNETELENLHYSIQCQLEADEKLFEKCRSYNY